MTIYGVRAMVVMKVFFMRVFSNIYTLFSKIGVFCIGVLETTKKTHNSKQFKLFFLKTLFVLTFVFLTALRIHFLWSLIFFTYGGTFFVKFFSPFFCLFQYDISKKDCVFLRILWQYMGKSDADQEGVFYTFFLEIF